MIESMSSRSWSNHRPSAGAWPGQRRVSSRLQRAATIEPVPRHGPRRQRSVRSARSGRRRAGVGVSVTAGCAHSTWPDQDSSNAVKLKISSGPNPLAGPGLEPQPETGQAHLIRYQALIAAAQNQAGLQLAQRCGARRRRIAVATQVCWKINSPATARSECRSRGGSARRGGGRRTGKAEIMGSATHPSFRSRPMGAIAPDTSLTDLVLRGLRIGANTIALVELLRSDWIGGAGQSGLWSSFR